MRELRITYHERLRVGVGRDPLSRVLEASGSRGDERVRPRAGSIVFLTKVMSTGLANWEWRTDSLSTGSLMSGDVSRRVCYDGTRWGDQGRFI